MDGVRVHSDVDRLAIELMYIKDIVGPRTYYQNKDNRLLRLQCFTHPKTAYPAGEAGARRHVLVLLAPYGDLTSAQIPKKFKHLKQHCSRIGGGTSNLLRCPTSTWNLWIARFASLPHPKHL